MSIILTRDNEIDIIVIVLPNSIGAENKIEKENSRYPAIKGVDYERNSGRL